jgi:hypothetical protein
MLDSVLRRFVGVSGVVGSFVVVENDGMLMIEEESKGLLLNGMRALCERRVWMITKHRQARDYRALIICGMHTQSF